MNNDNHKLAIAAIRDATDNLWPEHQQVIRQMLPVYDAAPDMLAALKQVRMHSGMFDSNEEFIHVCNAIKAALAKATGESQ